jgi:hypothetical protein
MSNRVVWISSDKKLEILYIAKTRKYQPYTRLNDQTYPMRGLNKNGTYCWRSYKSCDDAVAGLVTQ